MQLDQKRIISFRNHFKEKWDFLVLLLAIQNSLIIPLDLAFHPAWASTSAYQIVDNLVDGMFLIDMVVMFVTSFLDKAGHEVKDSRRIAERYMRSSRFVIDLLSLLGTGIVTQFYPTLKVFQCFKMNRVLRLGGII